MEIFLHSIPLTLLVFYNRVDDNIKLPATSIFAMILPSFGILLTCIEVCIFQIYGSCNINLEMRIRLRSDTRLSDLFRISSLGVIMTLTSFLLGFYAFES